MQKYNLYIFHFIVVLFFIYSIWHFIKFDDDVSLLYGLVFIIGICNPLNASSNPHGFFCPGDLNLYISYDKIKKFRFFPESCGLESFYLDEKQKVKTQTVAITIYLFYCYVTMLVIMFLSIISYLLHITFLRNSDLKSPYIIVGFLLTISLFSNFLVSIYYLTLKRKKKDELINVIEYNREASINFSSILKEQKEKR